MKTGKIKIKDKVYFEPDDEKQLIEVENVLKDKSEYKMFENMDYVIRINDKYYFKQHHRIEGSNYLLITDNQSCKAEVNGTAVIIDCYE